ncbi:MAG: sn-glycerol-3-phosphate ABC transporter ATP-binding protein UgpC [Oceanospirillaceae bacterium]|nr:sn-glycerol-3-phosphate ABC transporter ATP-binding protein UgpC [Oceanospirillaceae bacterium]
MASIKLNNICKHFDQVEVLKSVNIDIQHGEFVVLVGPSGCGKSTLLRSIAGLEQITSGDIYIGDTRVNELAPKDRDISMVFQSYALYPHMSVERNMGFSLEVQKVPKAQIKKAVKEVAESLGLTELLDRKPKALSGGQRQRVAMGRAIVRDPKVFLFDEPLSNLDAQLRVHMRLEIKALHQRLQSTIIYVTHDQVEAMTLADRIVVLNGGIVQQVGPPLEIYDTPTNLFVAGFMGSPSMNFIKTTVAEAGGEFYLETQTGVKLALLHQYQDLAVGMRICCGIRPEHILILNSTSGHLQARVKAVEPTGISEQIYCSFEGADLCIYSMQRTDCKENQSVSLQLDLQRLHLFCADSGQRLQQWPSIAENVSLGQASASS